MPPALVICDCELVAALAPAALLVTMREQASCVVPMLLETSLLSVHDFASIGLCWMCWISVELDWIGLDGGDYLLALNWIGHYFSGTVCVRFR